MPSTLRIRYTEHSIFYKFVQMLKLTGSPVKVEYKDMSKDIEPAKQVVVKPEFFRNVGSCGDCNICCVNTYWIPYVPLSPPEWAKDKLVAETIKINGKELHFYALKKSGCPLYVAGKCHFIPEPLVPRSVFAESVPFSCYFGANIALARYGDTLYVSRHLCKHHKQTVYTEDFKRADVLFFTRLKGFYEQLGIDTRHVEKVIETIAGYTPLTKWLKVGQ